MVWSRKQINDLLQKSSDAGVDFKLTDEQIADFITFNKSPGSDVGMSIMKGVSRIISQYGGKPAPCRYKAFEKQFAENKMEVFVFSNSRALCGGDSLNCLYVHDNSIYSVPPTGGDFENVKKQGIRSLCLADCFAALVGNAAEFMSDKYEIVEMNKVSSFEEMNLKVPNFLKKYLGKKDLFLKNEVNCSAEIKIV